MKKKFIFLINKKKLWFHCVLLHKDLNNFSLEFNINFSKLFCKRQKKKSLKIKTKNSKNTRDTPQGVPLPKFTAFLESYHS